MKPEPRFEIDNTGPIGDFKPESGPNDPSIPESNDSAEMDYCYIPRIRPSEANGFAVYTRNKRRNNKGVIGFFDMLEGNSGILREAGDAVSLNGDSGTSGGECDMIEIEVKEDPALARSGRLIRSRIEIGDLESGAVKVLGTPEMRKKEMKMSKKIFIKGRPTTVRELFETGLLEGYPVFYNGGKRGFPLRGTIKDAGILCSCSVCMGARVVPPCQFEIHACKSYRRASQYICLENGKSLLDVVKECRKSSVKTLDETIQNFIGPLPVKESLICRNCKGSFLATSAAKVEPLCDSCMIAINSEVDAECVKSRPLEPLLGLTMSENGEVHNILLKKGYRGRKKRQHSELTSCTKSSGRSSLHLSTRKKGQWKTTKMLLLPTSGTNSPGSLLKYTKSSSVLKLNSSASLHGSLKSKTKKILKKLSNTSSLPMLLKSGSPTVSVQSKSSSKITKKDQRMHRLVFEDGGLPDGTEVAYYSHGKKVRDGYKMGSGLICRCCSTLVSPSQFEAHAGWASRRKPYMYIYTSNGLSLHEFAISLLKGRKCSSRENEELCIICADGGKLVLCDGCPRAFHKECASLSGIPRGKWFCTYCQNEFQRERFVQRNANVVAAGRMLGIEPIDHITNRCTHVVKKPEESDVIACIICRGYDYSKTGFGPRTVILCDQCEKEYHVGCLKKSKMADLKELPKGKWFCSTSCKEIYSALQNLLDAGEEKLPYLSLDVVRKKQMEKSLVADMGFDVKWRLLNGKTRTRETRVLLSQAVAIFHDSFDPIVDLETGRDFIPSMVYGRNIRGQDFSGMYCAILTVNSTVVSAVILRIFGQEIAELPLAATLSGNQGRGYFQTLYSCIEKLLAFLNVKNIVLPSTSEAMSIWTEKFGFSKLPEEELLNYRKNCWQMISFKGTSVLEKAVPRCRIISHEEEDSD